MMLRLARVAAVHPEDHSVDLVMVDDGSRYAAAQVCAIGASTNTGRSDLPQVTATAEKWSLAERTDRDMRAVVGFLGPNSPIVVGFLFPQVNGVLFADANRRVDRHASDWYTSVDGQGNFEASHPSGTYLRIGTSPDHENLAGKDFDGNWAITKNTGAAVHLQVTVANAGAVKAKLHIDPSGNLTIENEGNTVVHTKGTATIQVDGAMTSSAASWTHTGPMTLNGSVAITGASLTHNGVNVGSTHRHGGVTAGPSNTGTPS